MLSVCIPIYNFDCTLLAKGLLKQAQSLEEDVEVIVIDDASEEVFRNLFKNLPEAIRFIQLEQNIGRSRIRNLLAKKANYDHLLFIDGDSSLIGDQLLSTYLKELKRADGVQVICGGSVYSEEAPPQKQILRWKYSKARERKSLDYSKKKPYRSFTTNNFIIDKKSFQSIKFDERIEKYGHEDTLFGFQLMQKQIRVNHINNVVLNGDLDENEQYIQKSRESVSNLLLILNYLDYDEKFIQLIPLLNTYFKIKLFGLEIFLRWWFKLSHSRLEHDFIKGKVSLFWFDLYRLGVLSTLYRKVNQK